MVKPAARSGGDQSIAYQHLSNTSRAGVFAACMRLTRYDFTA
jgi:hypothetical protein